MWAALADFALETASHPAKANIQFNGANNPRT
jgi:hypothetical protein